MSPTFRPIQTEHADARKPRMMDADTVAHCGESDNVKAGKAA
jgi:hypothetical protein